ncbi:MAG: hypothetical protein J0L79_04045 [Rickettsiales bacterium]|nr:hypothetical protein [Rickettsiales bacterium]MCA0254722.1 hypothetical protein [Pseudomonadota bacterium]
MKHHFFQEGVINFAGNAGVVDFNGANGVVFTKAIVPGAVVIGKIGDFAAITIGGNAGEIVFNDIGIKFGGAKIIVDNNNGPVNPIVDEAVALINDPSTTSLDLSGTGITDPNLSLVQRNLPNNQNISFVNFSNNPLINTHSVIHLCNDHNHSLISVDFTGCNINVDSFNAQLAESSIYQSPLVSCRFGSVNLLFTKAEAAIAILSNLHSFLGTNSTFDISNPEHRQSLIRFFKSPKAQKALKWLSENNQDLGLVFKGDAFVRELQILQSYHLFHLKGVCKTIADQESCLIPHDALPNALSYLSFDDIVEEVVVLAGDSE